jgi:hypothetical protein
MLRACALKHGGSWDKSLPYAEFSYNNSYQASLKMAPFEALYGRKCRTPLYLLAQKVHSTPITQQAEQSWLHTRREQMTCQSIFPEN